jgi:hypothetical protein
MKWTVRRFAGLLGVSVAAVAGGRALAVRAQQAPAQTAPSQPPRSLSMGGKKSVMTFFITSHGPGKGGDLGGVRGADAHCQALAKAEGAGDHTWRAYLSTSATGNQPAVNARDRIGQGPWYNGEGNRIALNLDELHRGMNAIDKENAVTERIDPVNGVGDTPNRHDILTGSRPDGTAFPPGSDLTCSNWMSSGAGRAQVGHHDRQGQGDGSKSWNSAHPSRGCSQADLEATGGAGLFYCFAID